jgi:hypothetical protein
MRTFIGASFITTLLAITVLSAPAALDPNLILYFTFDEQLDGREVEDMSGNGNNGKLRFGAKITNEPQEVHTGAGALTTFNNISAQVRVQPFNRMNNYRDNTFTFWLYIFNPVGAQSSILEKANVLVGNQKGFAPAIFLTDPGLHLIYKFAEDGIQAGPRFDLKTWYHVAGVKKGANLIIYINGEEKDKSHVNNFQQGEGQLRIGGTRIRGASFLMDEFQLYDRALTKKEVKAVFKGTFLSVEPQGKLTTTWGRLKTGR